MKQKNNSKKAVSEVIGYLLLISFAIVMSVIVYQGLKTYIFKDELSCDEGVSLYIDRITCDVNGGNYVLNLTLKNNGLFGIHGYYVKARNISFDKGLPTIDLTENLTYGGNNQTGRIIFLGADNNMYPNERRDSLFLINYPINLIEVIPLRMESYNGKKKPIMCTDARVSSVVTCS